MRTEPWRELWEPNLRLLRSIIHHCLDQIHWCLRGWAQPHRHRIRRGIRQVWAFQHRPKAQIRSWPIHWYVLHTSYLIILFTKCNMYFKYTTVTRKQATIYSLDVSKISSCHWIFNMKSDSDGDIHLAHIEKKNQISRASSLWADRRFVLVWAGLARAVGWKTMAIRS